MQMPPSPEYPAASFFSNYIKLVHTENVIGLLREQGQIVENLFKNLSDDQQTYRYADGKWSPKQMLGHMVDTERIFAYRALCIARAETQSLPGFDENDYVANADFDDQPLHSLLDQYHTVRQATVALAASLPEEAQSRLGRANNTPISSRALFTVIAGHEKHHLNILAERYGISVRP